ncbi:MAG: TIGR02996 domain-containing protein [Gemmataceae bacterium]
MSAAPALLAAIRDRPDDDTPRLAYADWLDDAGDAARAEFVRVQVRLARLADHDPARPALEDREHDLLAAHEPAWLGVPLGALTEWDWQRGFVNEVTCGPEVLREFVGRELFEAHPVRRWRPADPGPREGALAAALSSWAYRIEALDLNGLNLSVAELAPFLRRAPFGRLRELELGMGGGGLHAAPGLLAMCPFRATLEVVVLGDRQNRGETMVNARAIGDALSEAALHTVGLTGVRVDSSALADFLARRCATTISRLALPDTHLSPDAIPAFARPTPALTALDVSGTPLAGFALEPLLNAPALAGLRELGVNRCGSAAAVVRALLRSPFWRQADALRLADATAPTRLVEPLFAADGPPALRTLDLSNNFLYDAGVADLCNATWAGSLTWLGLGRNYLTDTAAERIAASGRFRQLRTLHLSYNHPRWLEDNDFDGRVTDRGAVALASSPGLAALRVLTLTGVSLTAAGVDALLNGPFWRLSGLGLGRCELTAEAVQVVARSPRLARLSFLDLSGNRDLRGEALRPLAESPYLPPLLELDIHGCGAADAVANELRLRLGRRLGA